MSLARRFVGGTPEEIEARAEIARKKYGDMTISEVMDRIIIWTLIGYMAITLCVILMFFSPLSDRLLSSILLIFVLSEWLTEFALWAFTYRGMRRTEAPLADLTKFSQLTKEGWRRAELVMDITTPFFSWLDGVRERMIPDWRERKDEKLDKLEPVTAKDIVNGLTHVATAVEALNKRMVEIEKQAKR